MHISSCVIHIIDYSVSCLMEEPAELVPEGAVAEAAQRPDAREHQDPLQHRLQLLLRLPLGPGVLEDAEVAVEDVDEPLHHVLVVRGDSFSTKSR